MITTIGTFKQAVTENGLVLNIDGTAAGDVQAQSDTEANMLLLDASADLIYFGGTANGVSIAKGGAITLLGTNKITHHTQIPATASIVSGSAVKRYGTTCVAGMLANANTDLFFIEHEIYAGWDGTDILFEIDWLPDSSLSAGNTVIWKVKYRSVAEGEVVDNLGEQTLTETYTSPVGGTVPGLIIHTRFTMPYNDATAPLTVDDHLHIMVYRDATADSYNGDAIISNFEMLWTANKLSTV
jgi:hypothetical protein